MTAASLYVVLLGGIAGGAVYLSWYWKKAHNHLQTQVLAMAQRYSTFQYDMHELAHSELVMDDGLFLDEGEALRLEGYENAFTNVQEAMRMILDEDAKRNMRYFFGDDYVS